MPPKRPSPALTKILADAKKFTAAAQNFRNRNAAPLAAMKQKIANLQREVKQLMATSNSSPITQAQVDAITLAITNATGILTASAETEAQVLTTAQNVETELQNARAANPGIDLTALTAAVTANTAAANVVAGNAQAALTALSPAPAPTGGTSTGS